MDRYVSLAMRTLQLAVFALCMLVTACGTDSDVGKCTSDLLETDRSFAAYSVENGPVAAFEQYLDIESLQLPAGAPPIFGRTEIVEAMSSGPEFGLDWVPQHAEAASACDLGWTWGTYEATFSDQTGTTIVSSGKYLNVWRRLDDGSWRVVVDAGNGSGESPRRVLREVTGNVLTSIAYPSASITIDPSFGFIGRFDFEIEGMAEGERFVFADTAGGKVKRLFVAHFEEILGDSDETFRYSFDDAVEIGGFKFRQNPYAYSNEAAAATNPNGEAAQTASLLREAGLELANELVMSRYVMVPDDEKKHEMILFYIENLSAFERRLGDLYDAEGRDTKILGDISQTLDGRARASFSIEAQTPE